MAKIAIVIGGLLILLGGAVYGIAATGQDKAPSITALIPAFFGLPMVALGLLALKESWRMHAMHGVALLGLLGAILPLGRFGMQLASGKPLAVLTTSSLLGMAALNIALVVLCVRSFIAARRAREATESPSEA